MSDPLRGWKVAELDDCCDIEYGTRVTKKEFAGTEYPCYGGGGESWRIDDWNREDCWIVSRFAMSEECVRYVKGKFFLNDSGLTIKPEDETILADDFLGYYLLSRQQDIYELGRGSAQRNLNVRSFRKFEVPLPPLSEQRRIVSVLDAAFAGLATATANTQKNLQNARELYESELNSKFSFTLDDPRLNQLGDHCDFENGDRGKNYPSKQHRTESGIPFINAGHLTSEGIDLSEMDYISRERFDLLGNGKIRKDDILFCLRGSLGKVASVNPLEEGAIASSLIILRAKPTISADYVLAYLHSKLAALFVDKYKNGAAQPNLSAKSLKSFRLPVPSLREQNQVLRQLDELRDKTSLLIVSFERKLAALSELKQSLLHRAFRGELSNNAITLSHSKSTPFARVVPGISENDLHAGIIACLYAFHEDDDDISVEDCGHTKAEKTAHLAEAFVGIELGRKPYKDAAGPNDFDKRREVDQHARESGYFDFIQRADGSYELQKLDHFEEIKQRTEQALGEQYSALEMLLDCLTPLVGKQTEVAATVFAAWNNLLLEGCDLPTDQQIVKAAREDWHQKKVDIMPGLFYEMLHWLRDVNIVPKGRGKYVGSRRA